MVDVLLGAQFKCPYGKGSDHAHTSQVTFKISRLTVFFPEVSNTVSYLNLWLSLSFAVSSEAQNGRIPPPTPKYTVLPATYLYGMTEKLDHRR